MQCVRPIYKWSVLPVFKGGKTLFGVAKRLCPRFPEEPRAQRHAELAVARREDAAAQAGEAQLALKRRRACCEAHSACERLLESGVRQQVDERHAVRVQLEGLQAAHERAWAPQFGWAESGQNRCCSDRGKILSHDETHETSVRKNMVFCSGQGFTTV